MTPEQAAALRAPFPPEAIGKLPKGGALLDYVGHAAVTDRLLAVDPAWAWEPLAYDADGLPLIRVDGTDATLWVRLTVAGVTRLGVGTAPVKSFDLPKQLVSDALRNAAMRFGVALDLWSKEDLHAEPPAPTATRDEVDALVARFDTIGDRAARARVKQGFVARFGKPADLRAADLEAAHAWLGEQIENVASDAGDPPPTLETSGPDDRGVAGDLVRDSEHREGAAAVVADTAAPDPVRIADQPGRAKLRAKLMARAGEAWPHLAAGERDERRYALTKLITRDDRQSFNDLTVAEAERLYEALGWVVDGTAGLSPRGSGSRRRWVLVDEDGNEVSVEVAA